MRGCHQQRCLAKELLTENCFNPCAFQDHFISSESAGHPVQIPWTWEQWEHVTAAAVMWITQLCSESLSLSTAEGWWKLHGQIRTFRGTALITVSKAAPDEDRNNSEDFLLLEDRQTQHTFHIFSSFPGDTLALMSEKIAWLHSEKNQVVPPVVAPKVDWNSTEQPFLHMLQSMGVRQTLKCLGKKLVHFNHCNFPVCPEENLFYFVSGQQRFCSSKSSHSTYFLTLLIYFNK